jgi:transcriptional adapter 2-alpha
MDKMNSWHIINPTNPHQDVHMPKKQALESAQSLPKRKPAVKKVSTDPPRPALGSQQSNEMAGYIPWRGEFQVEYQDNGEVILQDLSFDDANTPFERELNLAVVDIYQDILEERWYRKGILRDYGLLSWKNHRRMTCYCLIH